VNYQDWRSRLLEGVDQALYPADWLDWLVSTGQAVVWCNEKAAIIAAIRLYPSGVKEVHGLLAAGDAAAIRGLVPLAEEWGKAQGCIRAAIASRPGWAKIMRQDGYEPHQIEIVKEL
jgi:hypothetical protein